MHIGNCFALALVLLLTTPSALLASGDIMGIASVVDGDSIEIRGERIRLHGIDAPESRQLCTRPNGERWRCGQRASLALADRIGRGPVRCERRDRDRYDRTIAVCFKGNEDLNRWMVANGWAVAFRRYSLDYVADEDKARQSRLNIWSGRFDMPWDWRAQQQNR
jgi:endonuclease YncB( thermonuclease family)